MTNLETLARLLEENAPGAYMASEMTGSSYPEKRFRLLVSDS